HALGELEAIAPEVGEEAALAEERATMHKGQRLADELVALAAMIDGTDGGLAALRGAARRLDRIAGEHEHLPQAIAALARAGRETAAAAGRQAYVTAAEALSLARAKAAERLDVAVAAELEPLKLGAARFGTLIGTVAEDAWGPGGRDKVEFQVATNAGAEAG